MGLGVNLGGSGRGEAGNSDGGAARVAGLLVYDMKLFFVALGRSGFWSADAAFWSTLVRKSSARPAMSLNHDIASG